MQTSSRSREQLDPRSFAARKGHLPQLSISDDRHHVTEAIGHMYGEDDSPLSPQSSARYSIRSDRSLDGDTDVIKRRESLSRKPLPEPKVMNGNRLPPLPGSQNTSGMSLRNGWDDKHGASSISPPSARDNLLPDTANTHFPLNDIDYESSPAAVAQELSNLQALRRMSMDLGATGDPDLPPINAAAVPSAPSSTTSEDDSARLFWVPARLHPELAPTEFKSFLESKAEQIKRRSGELSAFSSPGASRSSSLSTNDDSSRLQRKKSMLSKQINNSSGYQDGADRLEKKKSEEANGQHTDPNLQELGDIMSGAIRRLSLDSKPDDGEAAGDMILPSLPGSSLRRSTRTKYQRPSSRKGPVDQNSYAERAKRRAAAGGPADNYVGPPTINIVPSDSIEFSNGTSDLASTLRDPSSESQRAAMNFSRPGNRSPSPPTKEAAVQPLLPAVSIVSERERNQSNNSSVHKPPKKIPTVPNLNGVSDNSTPQISDSSTDDHPVRTSSMAPPPTKAYTTKSETPKSNDLAPARDQRLKTGTPPPPSRPGLPVKQSSTRPSSRGTNMPPQTTPSQTLEQPSPLPGHDTNTSNLSFIPTLTVDKRQEQRRKEEKKSGWSWLLGKEESEKEKERSKSKTQKPPQSYDSTRLDVLQTSIDGVGKGRESLVLDRESLKLEEERKKESLRKFSGGEKKEKESIFSSIFGGKKHKAEKEAQKRAQERLSPEPRYREMKPDIDYNWTRFSILEERTIYRMAHIKLANPRRALYSQVLLSNFMYSYLAKVQQMHPQMNLPTSAKQQRKQKEQQQTQQHQPQPDEFTQYQRYQQQQAQQTPSSHDSGSSQEQHSGYEGDTNMYNFNYSRENPRSDLRGNQHSMDYSSSPTTSSQHYSQEGGSGDDSYGVGGGASAHYHHQQQPRQNSSHQQRPPQQGHGQQKHSAPGYRYDDDDDDDDDMW